MYTSPRGARTDGTPRGENPRCDGTENARDPDGDAYMRAVPREIEVVRRGSQPQGRGGGAVPRVSGRGTLNVRGRAIAIQRDSRFARRALLPGIVSLIVSPVP